MNTRICVTAVLLLLTAACATTTTMPLRQFDDIPLPGGLTYQPERSVVIESPTLKAAQLVYRGRLEPVSLADAMRATLEPNGWRHVSRTTTATEGTWQIYEKDGNALEVHIYEGLWYTYLAISASETLLTSTAETKDGAPKTARLEASIDPPATPAAETASDRPTRGTDGSFTQRVKDFFTNLFTW